jgi:hypothetical protein
MASQNSSIQFESGQDNHDGESQYIDINLGTQKGNQLQFSYGESEISITIWDNQAMKLLRLKLPQQHSAQLQMVNTYIH